MLVAASMLLLLGFAAIAIDSGAALDERRRDQGAADAAALSAAVTARSAPVQAGCRAASQPGGIERKAACNGAVVAIEVANANLGAAFAESAFADTSRCSNAAFPSEFHPGNPNRGIVPRTESNLLVCIRFNQNMSKVHVLLPIVEVDTTFGRVLGRETIEVSARAEAELTSGQLGSILPFAMGPLGAGMTSACVFEPGSGLAEGACGGPSDGNFGYLMSYLYGDETLGTPIACGSAGGYNDATRIAASIAKGSDHYFLPVSLAGGIYNDLAECPNTNQPISEVDVRTGGFSSAARNGFFAANNLGTEGRLLCKGDLVGLEPDWMTPAWSSDGSCVPVNNQLAGPVDDRPLWDFLTAGISETNPSGACIGVDNTAKMVACLSAWRNWGSTHTQVLFGEDILEGTRFGWVPLLNANPQQGGSGYYLITDFVPVYLNSTYFGCPGPNNCTIIHTPGETSASSQLPCSSTADLSCGLGTSGNHALDAASALVMTRDMLPEPIANFPTDTSLLRYNLSQ